MRPANHENQITIQQIESFLQHTESCIERLDRAVGQLPKVDKDENSECPFAKELYQEKEDAQKKLAECLSQLYEYRKWVLDQIKKCKNNLVVISANADRLNNDLPHREFTEAEVRLAAIYKKLVRLNEKIEKTVKKCQKAIQQAAEKRDPLYTEDDDDHDEAFHEERQEQEIDEFLCKMLGKTP